AGRGGPDAGRCEPSAPRAGGAGHGDRSPGAMPSPRCPARSVGCGGVTPDELWLATMWPFVCGWLPAPPAAVLEIGCGPLGGFVPALRSAGDDATGGDPEAPEGPWDHRGEVGRDELGRPPAAGGGGASRRPV